jgi:hypothetical protein
MAPWAVRPTSGVAEPCRIVVREEARCGNSEPPLTHRNLGLGGSTSG